MKILTINSRNRRDFQATYICQHCGQTEDRSGYDDRHFHEVVVPKLVCKKCDLTAGGDYKPLSTKYPDGMSV